MIKKRIQENGELFDMLVPEMMEVEWEGGTG